MAADLPAHRATIREDGATLAGGMRLFNVACQGQQVRLVFPDRWQRRCAERGTEATYIDLLQFLDELEQHITALMERMEGSEP